jgi:DNA mismatch repair ATPase MutS
MGQSDSLMDGKSYCLAELDRIRGVFAPGATPRLFLFDELFRGAHAIEGILAEALQIVDRLEPTGRRLSRSAPGRS